PYDGKPGAGASRHNRHSRTDIDPLALCFGKRGEDSVNVIQKEQKPTEVLLVEDNLGDVRLAQEAFRDVNSAINLHLAADGIEAMAFLKRQGGHVHAPRPDLIVLDLNLPKMN